MESGVEVFEAADGLGVSGERLGPGVGMVPEVVLVCFERSDLHLGLGAVWGGEFLEALVGLVKSGVGFLLARLAVRTSPRVAPSEFDRHMACWRACSMSAITAATSLIFGAGPPVPTAVEIGESPPLFQQRTLCGAQLGGHVPWDRRRDRVSFGSEPAAVERVT